MSGECKPKYQSEQTLGVERKVKGSLDTRDLNDCRLGDKGKISPGIISAY